MEGWAGLGRAGRAEARSHSFQKEARRGSQTEQRQRQRQLLLLLHCSALQQETKLSRLIACGPFMQGPVNSKSTAKLHSIYLNHHFSKYIYPPPHARISIRIWKA